MLVRGIAASDVGATDLEHIGFQLIATHGRTWLWYRDRLAAARSTLERTQRVAVGLEQRIGSFSKPPTCVAIGEPEKSIVRERTRLLRAAERPPVCWFSC